MAALALGLFPYKDRTSRSQLSKVVNNASCWDCLDSILEKQNVDCMTEKLNILKRSRAVCIYYKQIFLTFYHSYFLIVTFLNLNLIVTSEDVCRNIRNVK